MLAGLIREMRRAGKTVVYCHGVFDLLHIGHIRYLTQCKELADLLVVTVTPDIYVDKGPHRPAFSQELRAEALASLDCVDYVGINQWPTAEETLQLLRPDLYAKGSDFKNAESDATGKLQREQEVCRKLGVKLVFTQDIVYSSSNLINRFFSTYSHDVQSYLKLFRNRFSLDEILSVIDNMASLKVVVIGDTIIDEYCYCHTLGTSSKSPVLAMQFDSEDHFAGGVLAVANHLAEYVSAVSLFTPIGEGFDRGDFIKAAMSPKVDPHLYEQKGAPTLVKRRYIEGYSIQKLLEIYHMDDSGLDSGEDERMRQDLAQALSAADLVVVADFGHGAISAETRKVLLAKAPFLAVNTQMNAGNRGFNTLDKYEGAHFASLAEPELRLNTRNQTSPVRGLASEVLHNCDLGRLMITRGKRGAVVCDQGDGYCAVPALTVKVVDSLGAGDAVFSITSLAAKVDGRLEVMGFLGSVVGALAVEIIGNKVPVTKNAVSKYITSLLK